MKNLKPTPPGWPRISSALVYDDAAKAIDFLCDAFGFEVRLRIEGENGVIEHSELEFGDGLVMVSQAKPEKFPNRQSPARVGGVNTQSLFAYVDDIEAHLAQARAAGATIVKEIETHDYGDDYWSDRTYEARDLEGHGFWFAQRITTRGKSA